MNAILPKTTVKKPVFVTDYPEALKPFYMKVSEETPTDGIVPQGPTVACTDLLIPTIGELIGGSEREEQLDHLKARMEGQGLKHGKFDWYLDLRKYGTVPHAGFGMGFERLIQFLTGLHIYDVTIAPRFVDCIDTNSQNPGRAKFF